MRERVTLQSPPSVDDGAGGQTGDWVAVASLWAEVLPVRGNEAVQSAVSTGMTQYRVTIRPRAIDSAQRLVWRGQQLDIRAVMVDPSRGSTVLLCEGQAL